MIGSFSRRTLLHVAKTTIMRNMHNFYFSNSIPTVDNILTAVNDYPILPDFKKKNCMKCEELNLYWPDLFTQSARAGITVLPPHKETLGDTQVAMQVACSSCVTNV